MAEGSNELDVLIIGAGLSGIGAAVHLTKKCPNKTFALLEMRDAIGGTWDLFRYPGIRSDSDMYTLGYVFKPWTDRQAIADGDKIRTYIRETAAEYGINDKIRFRRKVIGLNWSPTDARWHVRVENLETGEVETVHARFVICCSGYYKYAHGYTPDFEGRDDFEGTVIHPQLWPKDLDYRGKRVVVIGSGATAITLVPAMAKDAAHVTMLQRSPSYILSLPEEDPTAKYLRKFLSPMGVYAATRMKRVLLSMAMYQYARRRPDEMRRFLIGEIKKVLGDKFEKEHFSPKYKVWDERLCLVPDNDLFIAMKEGRADIVTDHIDRFTKGGLRLKSGKELEADIIVTATGLVVEALGGAALTVDGEPVKISDKFYYKGAMLEDVPNLAMVFGYTNSSWTLKADLIADFCCRVINHMDRHGYEAATAQGQPVGDGGPFIGLTSGYLKRALDLMPRQGTAAPWKLYQNYFLDWFMMKLRPLDDGALTFSNPSQATRAQRTSASQDGAAVASS